MSLATLTVNAGYIVDNTQKFVIIHGSMVLGGTVYEVGGVPLDSVLLALPEATTNSGVAWCILTDDTGSGYIFQRIKATGTMMILQVPPSGSSDDRCAAATVAEQYHFRGHRHARSISTPHSSATRNHIGGTTFNALDPLVQVPLTLFGGLYTECNAESLPEGGSPLNINCDYNLGKVFQRPGKESAFTYSESVIAKTAAFTQSIGTGAAWSAGSVTLNQGTGGAPTPHNFNRFSPSQGATDSPIPSGLLPIFLSAIPCFTGLCLRTRLVLFSSHRSPIPSAVVGCR